MDKLHIAFGISVIADDGRIGKHEQNNRQKVVAPTANLAFQRHLRQGHTFKACVLVQTRGQDDDGGTRTHHKRVHKHPQHLHQALIDRVFHIGSRCRIRRRTHTRFIRKQATLDALYHRHRNHRAKKAARYRIKLKRFGHDQGKNIGQNGVIDGGNVQRHQQIQHRHQRHKAFGHARNALDAAKNNQGRHHHQGHTYPRHLHAECAQIQHHIGLVPAPSVRSGADNGIGLHGIEHKAISENQGDGKHHAQPFLFQTLSDVIRRAATKLLIVAVAHLKQLRQ